MESGAVSYDPERDDATGGATHADAVLAEHGDRLLAIDGVEGCMIEESGGAATIVVLLGDPRARDRIPPEINGVPTRVRVTGPIKSQ
ncbi:MAG: hypothetical protein AAFX79_03640 [Planctomycetota bacterium]